MTPLVVRALKRLRSSQPLNAIVTGAARSLLKAGRWDSEFVVKHLHRMGHVEQTLPNGRRLRLWSQADDLVSNLVYWRGWEAYEPGTSNLFFKFAERSSFSVDVGAYVGFFTLLAAHANSAGHVLAIEPFPLNFERLSANVQRNDLTNVECVPTAVGNSEGEADFYYVGAGGLPCSSGLSHDFLGGVTGVQRIGVPVVTLDALLSERGVPRVDLVKIDTETTEPDVLRGMSTVLKRDRPHIFCEVLAGYSTGAALAQILGPLGYSFFHLTPEGPVAKEDIVGHASWLNYLFTTLSPRDVHDRWIEAMRQPPAP